MRYFLADSTDPHYNLALEEYLFDTVSEDLFMLWQNEKSVIIGKNQNAYAEVDFAYAKQNGISVVRRITGGGAVFHDLGNINYTFISVQAKEDMDFKYFTSPIADALEKLGVSVSFSGRNDLLLSDGRKISGNARCERNGRIMHHGTLLFSSDISKLSEVLHVNKTKMLSKGVKSVKSVVGNIYDELETKLSPREFMECIKQSISQRYGCAQLVLSKEDEERIAKLKAEKYDTEKWNLSTNLPFEYSDERYFPFGLVQTKFCVKDGRFFNVKIYGDFFGKTDISDIEKMLDGSLYEKKKVEKILCECGVENYINGACAQEIAELFFTY